MNAIKKDLLKDCPVFSATRCVHCSGFNWVI